jgi:SAM-dependent methyltransferase
MAISPSDHRSCPGCGSDRRKHLGNKAGFELVRCTRCATVFVGTPTSELGSQDYETYYDAGNLTVPDFVDRRLDEMVATLASFRRTGRWLDIGCGAGSLVRAAARADWDVEGTEIAPQPVAMLCREGFRVHLGDVMDLELTPGTYDVVSLIEVLEHLRDPFAILQRARDLLRPGGALYLTTPHAAGISGRVLGLGWSVLSPPEHLQLFSIRGLGRSASKAGFDELVIHSRGVNPYELLSSLRRPGDARRTSISGGERVESAYRLNSALVSNSAGTRVKAGVNLVLDRLALGDSFTCRALRPGP